MEEKGREMKHILIGSSVVANSIDPVYLPDSTYNLAFSAQWPRYNKAQLEKYIDCFPNLKSVIWGITYPVLWKDEFEDGNNFAITNYDIYMDIRFDHNLLYHSELLSTRYSSLKKWLKYYLLHKKTVRCNTLGLESVIELSKKEKDKKKWFDAIPRDVKEHTLSTDEKYNKIFHSNVQRMHDVAKLCRDRGVMLYIVIPPVHEEYYKLVDNEPLQQMYTAIKEVADQWENVRWYNYFQDDRFTGDDFFDGNHLTSDVGAKKFAKILRKDIYGIEE
jgi:hypothetical protein